MKSKRAFGSKKPTRACFLSNALFLMPVSLSETRLTARSLSRWLRNQAFEGESGRANQTTKAQRHVTPPNYQYPLGNSSRQIKNVAGIPHKIGAASVPASHQREASKLPSQCMTRSDNEISCLLLLLTVRSWVGRSANKTYNATPSERRTVRIISGTAPEYGTIGDTYYQIHCRRGISLRVNQNPVMRVSPLTPFSYLDCIAGVRSLTYGVTAASNNPIKTESSRQL